jgi:hypothetical protein
VPGSTIPQDNSFHAPTFSAPQEDAPLEVLAGYWSQSHSFDTEQPTPATRQRLLEAVQKKPELLPSLLRLLPETQDANQVIKRVYDQNFAHFTKDWSKEVQSFLELHSEFFRDKLISEAASAKDDQEGGYVDNSDELTALANLDWRQAYPVLQTLTTERGTRTSCLARTLIYRHDITQAPALAERDRVELQSIVSNRTALGYCRDHAADALFETDWDGRDAWYLSLFHDSTIRRFTDKNYGYTPLSDPVGAHPDHWIPIMTVLVADPDRAVHDAAVEALVQFHLRSGRKDALEPLLPWLFDPSWSSADDRLRLIQTVDQLDMTESIPGLIAVLSQEGHNTERSYAAESLAHFKDARANSALRIALEREKEADHRRRIIKALIACHGVPPAEAADAIEQYANYTKDRAGQDAFESSEYSYGKSPLPVQVALGAELARTGPPEEAVEILIQRARQAGPEHAVESTRLHALLSSWPSGSADREIVREIQQESITAQVLANALARRTSLRTSVGPELQSLASTNGVRSGFAVVLLGDAQQESAILRGTDVAAQAAVMASARLVREKLNVQEVGALSSSSSSLLASAATAYLETEDSPRARAFVLAQHSNEAKIIGARESYDPGHSSYVTFDRLETQLQAEVKSGKGAEEIYALLSAGYWGDAGQIVIRVTNQGAELQYVETGKPIKKKALTPENWTSLLGFLHDNHVDDLGPLNLAADDGMQYEYIHLDRAGGRRVFMNNPGIGGSGGSTYDRLCDAFRKTTNAAFR